MNLFEPDHSNDSLIGIQIVSLEGMIFRLHSFNYCGIPYFNKVVNGKVQKKLFTVYGFDKNWADRINSKKEN